MNKKVMIVMLLIIVMSFGSVYANTTENQAAKDLNEIQILKGNGDDLNLSGELTRAEGATFIVNLLGVEDEVIANKIDYLALDFTDVFGTDWFSPYVGYCVDKGIIDGYSDGTFRAQDKLSEQAFVKMVLGAMGYEHGVDFNWSETFSFAYSEGILTDKEYKDMVSNTSPYTRGKVAQLLHHVLSLTDATGDKNMVDTFIDQGILTREEATEYGFIMDSVDMKVSDFKQNNGLMFTVLFNEMPKPLTSENVVIREKNSDITIEASKVLVADIQRMYYITVEDQVPDKEYTLTLTNVEDLQGNVLEDYNYDFFGFRDSDYDSAYYRVSRAELKTMNMLDVTFTQPIDITAISPDDILIQRDEIPFISGDSDNMSLDVDGSNPYVLHIEFLDFGFTFEDVFEVVVSKNAKSLYGVNLKDGQDDSTRFTSIAFEEEEFALTETILESEKSLLLVFNKNINKTIAEQVFSYYVTKSGQPIAILEAEVVKNGEYTNKAVRLTMNEEIIANGTYALTINQAYDTSRDESIIEEQMDIIPKVLVKPTLIIDSIKTTANNRIEVVLESYLDEEEAIKTSHYVVRNSLTDTVIGIPKQVYYDRYTSLPTVVLEFSSESLFKDGESYELVIDSDMKVDNGSTLKLDAKKTFVDVKDDYTSKIIKKAMYIGKNIVLIKGQAEFVLDIPNVLNSNYELQYTEDDLVKTMEPIGVEYFNEHIILIRFEDMDKDVEYSLKINEIKIGSDKIVDTSKDLLKVITEEIR